MQFSIKSMLLRSSAVVSCVGAGALCIDAPAQAATAQNAVAEQFQSLSNGDCSFRLIAVVEGTVADTAPNIDHYQYVVVDSSGQIVFGGTVFDIGVGFSITSSTGLRIPASASPGSYSAQIIDVTTPNPSTSGPVGGAVIADIPIQPSVLSLAGPACSRLVTGGSATNQAPTADAGPDQTVAGGASVTLPASGSDPDNDPLAFAWTQLSGPAAQTFPVTNPTTGALSFTAPAKTNAQQTMTFELTTSDGNLTDTDTVSVFVAPNQSPNADAGPDQSVGVGDTVTLDATSSNDPDGDALTFSWVQISGPSVSLSNQLTAQPTFVAPSVTGQQTLVFSVQANDGLAAGDDTVSITVDSNGRPVVDAGPDQTVNGGDAVTLSGSGTDPENDPVTYQWTQTGGPSVALSGDTTTSPTFTAPARTNSAQALTFQLVGTDPGGSGAPDTVTITVAANQAPSANAGNPQNVVGGSTVTLDGASSTDPEGDALTYQWTQVSGPAVTLLGANTAAPSFTAPPRTNSTQAIELQLTVSDALGASSVANTTVTVLANGLPVADAGPDQTQAGGSTITLDGSGSTDPDGDTVNYSWVQTGGPAVTLNGASTVNPTFVAPSATSSLQVLTFELTVSDNVTAGGAGSSSRVAPSVAAQTSSPQRDTVQISILANNPPVAEAGPDQGPIDSGQTVTLDGTGSSDADGDSLTYSWTQISGTPVTLTGENTAQPSFVAPLVNGTDDLVFQLVVNDGQADSAADTVTIGIRAIGNITIVQQVIGSDVSVAFTSSLAALNSSITTQGGVGQLFAPGVSAGSYTITAEELSAQGFAVTAINCSDTDSVANLASRSVALELSPNENLVCVFSMVNSREAASVAITKFLTGRNALILAHQPDLQRRIDRLRGNPATPGSATAFGLPVPGSGALPVNGMINQGRARLSTSLSMVNAATTNPVDRRARPVDIWAEIYFSNARIGDQDGAFSVTYLGADYRVSNKLLVGALIGLDDFNDRNELEIGEGEGNGWLAGPYITLKLAPQLFVEGRAAWGRSENRVNPIGSFTDDFNTSRSFYSGSLIGQFEIGKSTVLQPEVTIRHLSETTEAYVDSLGIAIPSQSVSQGDIAFNPRISHLISQSNGWSLRPYGEVGGVYTFGVGTTPQLSQLLPELQGLSFDTFRARVEGGLDVFTSGGVRASISAFHDGIGTDVFRSSGAQVSVSVGF